MDSPCACRRTLQAPCNATGGQTSHLCKSGEYAGLLPQGLIACRSKGAELNSCPLRQRDHAGAAGTPRRKSCMFCVCRRIWYGQVCRYHGRLSHNRPPRPLVTPSAPKGLQCNPAGFAPQVCTTVVRNVIRSTWFEGCVRTLFS